MKKSQEGFTFEYLLIVVVVIVIAAVVVTLGLTHKNKTVSSNIHTTSTPAKSTTTSSTSPINQNIKKIPELSIQITVPDSIKDLVYTSQTTSSNGQSMPVADFSTQNLTAMEPACVSSNSTALGRLSKTNGQYPADASTANGKLIKQFSTYYISYTAPQASCAVQNNSAEQLLESQRKDFQAALNSIQQI